MWVRLVLQGFLLQVFLPSDNHMTTRINSMRTEHRGSILPTSTVVGGNAMALQCMCELTNLHITAQWLCPLQWKTNPCEYYSHIYIYIPNGILCFSWCHLSVDNRKNLINVVSLQPTLDDKHTSITWTFKSRTTCGLKSPTRWATMKMLLKFAWKLCMWVQKDQDYIDHENLPRKPMQALLSLSCKQDKLYYWQSIFKPKKLLNVGIDEFITNKGRSYL